MYFTLTVASKFAIFELSWLQNVWNIATEGVKNTRHWSGRTETAIENEVSPAGCQPAVIAAAIHQWRRR